MEVSLIETLQEIIVDYAEYLYRETTQLIEGDDYIDYNYDGPIFAFKVDKGQLCLVNNTQIVSEGGEVLCVEPGDLIRPRTNQILGAFSKYRYWEDKLHAANKISSFPEATKTELQIVKNNLMGFAMQMLKPLAESYSIRLEPIRRYYPPMPDSIRDPEEGPYRRLPACKIQVDCGILQITNNPPAELALKIEVFNDLLNTADTEIKRMQIPKDAIVATIEPGTIDGNGMRHKPTEKPSKRAEIVRKIMTFPRYFNDNEKVEQLAKELDANNIPMTVFRFSKGNNAEMRLKANPPKTYIEVAKNKKHAAYKKLFNSQGGSLVQGLYKK